MSEGIKFPSARQPVVDVDDRGLQTFTRPWFLFFQQVFERVGGSISASTSDLANSLFEDAGSGEANAEIFATQQTFGQLPAFAQAQQIEALQTQLDEQRDLIAELIKEINNIKQGVVI